MLKATSARAEGCAAVLPSGSAVTAVLIRARWPLTRHYMQSSRLTAASLARPRASAMLSYLCLFVCSRFLNPFKLEFLLSIDLLLNSEIKFIIYKKTHSRPLLLQTNLVSHA